jgi:hypothetical protein
MIKKMLSVELVEIGSRAIILVLYTKILCFLSLHLRAPFVHIAHLRLKSAAFSLLS